MEIINQRETWPFERAKEILSFLKLNRAGLGVWDGTKLKINGDYSTWTTEVTGQQLSEILKTDLLEIKFESISCDTLRPEYIIQQKK